VAHFDPECTPPGAQRHLFPTPCTGAPRYHVIDPTGTTRAATTSLGVALTVALHLVAIDAQAWIATTGGATARIDHTGITTNTPTHPWIQTLDTTLPRPLTSL
jgi:hypothetical protein